MKADDRHYSPSETRRNTFRENVYFRVSKVFYLYKHLHLLIEIQAVSNHLPKISYLNTGFDVVNKTLWKTFQPLVRRLTEKKTLFDPGPDLNKIKIKSFTDQQCSIFTFKQYSLSR